MTQTHMRPSFFIIGANKCGTSSLYRYLVDHPAVLSCAGKEPNFFGTHTPDDIAGHIDEYFALFPTDDGGPLTFEWEASNPYCPAHDTVSETVITEGTWEPRETILALDAFMSAQVGSIFVDFGAQLGWFTLLAASCGAETIAVEADTDNLGVPAPAKRKPAHFLESDGDLEP